MNSGKWEELIKVTKERIPMFDQDMIQEIYEKGYTGGYVRAEDVFDNPRAAQIIRFVGSGKRILDIGIGVGDIALALMAKGNEVIGLDISSKAVKICQERGIEAYRVNIESDPLPKLGDFDAILMLGIIEYLIDPLISLKKTRELLRSSGFLIISTPNAAYIKWRLQLLLGRVPDFGENRQAFKEVRPYNLHHKTTLTIPSLYKLLQMAGFTVIYMEPEDYGVSKMWSRPGLKLLRKCLRSSWPSLFARAVVVKAVPQ